MVNYIADYLENIRECRVFPAVAPGYTRHLIPDIFLLVFPSLQSV